MATQSNTLTIIIRGHFNRERLGKVKEEEGSEKKMKPKQGTEKGEREREKERGKGSMTTGNEKISTKKEKAPGEAMTAASIPRREEDKRDQENAKIKESKARKQALEDRWVCGSQPDRDIAYI